MGIWDQERIGTSVPRLAYEVLASDADLLGFFGAAGIGFHGREEARAGLFPPRVPYLASIGDRAGDTRGLGNTGRRVIPVLVVGYVHPLQPCLPDITPPSVVTLGAKAAGVLTGSYRWLLTKTTAAGESFVGEVPGPGGKIVAWSAAALVSAEQITLNIPAHGGTGARLWRCEASGTRFRFRKYISGAGGGTFVDGATGDTGAPDSALSQESAPIRHGTERLMEYVNTVLAGREPLAQDNRAQVYKAMTFDEIGDDYLPALNVRRVTLEAAMPTKFTFTTRQQKVDV